ncbi:cytochrome P450 89A2-like [Ziziphus jujuba]|uniref:Cytochrome P450 89A2-like n=1 Tax=Ziziphus jujuba TaxID=326968 RepID=A0A6P3ZI27_ZIZJJ|nr:cytochrome P450 89A2-like [Ziziphus jujuba]
METWFVIVVSLCISYLLKSIFSLVFRDGTTTRKLTATATLPPGPINLPIIGNIFWLRKSFSELEPILRNLHAKYGPIVTLHIGPRPAIFIRSRFLAHQALVQNGAVFADRPPALATSKIISSNQHNISSAFYGSTWRLLRRNLTSEILSPLRVKSYSRARKWVLEILVSSLQSKSKSKSQTEPEPEAVLVKDHLQYAMFCLLTLMCFGDKLDEKQIKEIEAAQRRMLLAFGRFNLLNFWPRLTKILFRKRWQQFLHLREEQERILVPLINARKTKLQSKVDQSDNKASEEEGEEFVVSYVDTLLELQLPDEKRKLDECEIVSLCSEFLNAGTDTTSTALEWILANIVKHPRIQERLLAEIKGVVGGDGDEVQVEEVKEEDLHKMAYLKAVILEGLRRHPPGHFVLPHAVTEDVVLDGHLVPKDGSVNFMVAEIGWDPNVWEDPMAFKPERFLRDGRGGDADADCFDITGSREIKMMPFGVGRRICPGSGLAILHLEYFVANLVWKFEWTADNGDELDLSEKQEFTMVMKNPLKARISPRLNKSP